jgi:recombinational DNA repair ATPase RecF
VLDDVMSELDLAHRQRHISFIKKFDQVFITATKLEVEGASQYQIKKNEQKEVF